MDKKIWLITGVSTGLGKALAQAVLEHGDFVIGTFRNADQAADFTSQNPGNALGLTLDITDPAQIKAVFQTVSTQFGRLDVLVNNAGYGFAGAVEEATLTEVRAVFEANVFGTLAVTQAALPLFRQQRSGHIVQMSSHSGVKGFPGFGIYSASKFALEGFSEALAQEIAPLGIKLTLVEPGPFRTNFAGSSFRQAAQVIADYAPTAGAFRQRMEQVNGKQEGDPAKAAEAIISLIGSENPPLRLPLGKVALGTIGAKLDSVRQDLEAGRETAANAVFV